MESTIKVRYKYRNLSKTELVCDLTTFIDKYVILQPTIDYSYQTYIYNDIELFSTKHLKRMVLRAFGATRGVIGLKQLQPNMYAIDRIKIYDSSFSISLGCYKKELQNELKKFKGCILDFSSIQLLGWKGDNNV